VFDGYGQNRIYIVLAFTKLLMSRISKYQENVLKFLKTKSLITRTSETTRNILNCLLDLSDHIPAILCLTILNNQCKKYNLKIHGYYIAGAVDLMMLVAKVCCNRNYFDKLYGKDAIDNMINETVCWFYWSVSQNIETLNMNKNERHNPRTFQLCIEYSAKYIPRIIQKSEHVSTMRMKKTDIYSYNFENSKILKEYKKKNRLDKLVLKQDLENRYGSVCCLAVCLGWLLGQGDEQVMEELEKMGQHIGVFLKMADDFKFMERDIITGNNNGTSNQSTNYVVNYGIKEAYLEIIESKTSFLEQSMHIGCDTKTIKEIIDIVIKEVDQIVDDISVDINTQYDDCSTI